MRNPGYSAPAGSIRLLESESAQEKSCHDGRHPQVLVGKCVTLLSPITHLPHSARAIVPQMSTYSLSRAAQLLGVSTDTARRWAEAGRLPTSRDAAGRRTVDGRDLAAFAVEVGADPRGDDLPRTSARNAFPGIVTRVVLGDVAAQVEVQAGPHRVVSLLTREAVEELGLEVGQEAVASVKATNVTVSPR
jgi:molybdopterin-binding protein